jgi:hypothetical protein
MICLILAAIESGILKNLRISGRRIIKAVPTSGPKKFPDPPIIMIERMKIDSARVKLVGSMYVIYPAKRTPETAAKPAEMVKEVILKFVVFFPIDNAESSSSLIALRTLPNEELLRR